MRRRSPGLFLIANNASRSAMGDESNSMPNARGGAIFLAKTGQLGPLACPLLNVPTFDGHLNWSNTALEEVFYGIRTAQEVDSGIQARSGSSGGYEREAQG